MIHLDHVSLNFKDQYILKDFTEHIHPQELVGISGKSGCGKSSLLRALLGFVPLAEGSIRIGGLPLGPSTVTEIRKMIAYLPQDLNFPVESVRDMIRIPFELHANRQLHFSEEELFELWSRLNLDRKLYNRKVHKISGGQRQRILLSVMVMLHKPLCLIDEPASALDSDSSEKVSELLRRLCEKGSTLVVVSHDPKFLAQCDRTIIL